MSVRRLSKLKWIMSLVFLYLTALPSAQANDIESLDKQTDETITDACHGFVLEMFSEETGRCDPNKTDDSSTNYKPPKNNDLPTTHIKLGKRQERDLDITIECKNEYMCMEQRVKVRNAGHPISQADYDKVAQHCEKHYSCIEYFFRDWPKPLPKVSKKPADIGLTFDELSENNDNPAPNNPSFIEPFGSNTNAPSQDSLASGAVGFDSLENHRFQEKNALLANKAYKKLYSETYNKSLIKALDQRCKDLNLNYRTPASPRSLREDMRYFQSGFKNYGNCYKTVAENWNAQAYADSLANYQQKLAGIEQKYNADLSKKRQPKSIDSEISTMQQRLSEKTEQLKTQLKKGPDWIESLYASGRYKRPNSGPSTMAILSQTLTQMNNSLAQQNRQQQQQLNRMLQSINSNSYNSPNIKVPKPVTSNISTPKVNVPSVRNYNQTPAVTNSSVSNSQNTLGSMSSFACHAPAMQVCLYYEMPSQALQSYRQRCAAQGNKVLSQCPGSAPSCKMKNFAGAVTTYNYDMSEMEATRKSCVAGNGIFSR